MLSAEYLRRQAEQCLRIARTCFDLAAATQLRVMAENLQAKAAELDEDSDVSPYMMTGNGSSAGDGDRG